MGANVVAAASLANAAMYAFMSVFSDDVVDTVMGLVTVANALLDERDDEFGASDDRAGTPSSARARTAADARGTTPPQATPFSAESARSAEAPASATSRRRSSGADAGAEKHSQALRQPGSDALVGAEILREEFGYDDGGVGECRGSAAENQLDERLGGGGADAPLRLSLGGGGTAGDVHLLLHRVLVQSLETDGGFVQRREKRRLERTRQRVVLVVVVRL